MDKVPFQIVEPEPHPVTRAELQERALSQIDTAWDRYEDALACGEQAAAAQWASVAECFHEVAVQFGLW